MTNKTADETSTVDTDRQLSLASPEQIRDWEDVPVTTETAVHDDFDHCNTNIDGQVVAAVENEGGELLVLCNDELGVAILPHGDVEGTSDWAAVVREETEALTGVSIALDGIELLREIDHVVNEGFDPDEGSTLDSEGPDREEKPRRTTYRIIFSGRPVGGEIQECKRSADAGSDGWCAVWTTDLPEGVDVPDGGPGDDLRYALDP